jgi:hypothetical protein
MLQLRLHVESVLLSLMPQTSILDRCQILFQPRYDIHACGHVVSTNTIWCLLQSFQSIKQEP